MVRLTPADSCYYVRQSSAPKDVDDERLELAEARAGSLLDGFYVGKRGKRRPLVCLTMHDEQGKCPVFASSAEAHEVTGIADQLIRRAAEGKYSAGGHRWLYLDKLPRGLADSSKYFTFKGCSAKRAVVWLDAPDADGICPMFPSTVEASRVARIPQQTVHWQAMRRQSFAFLDDLLRQGDVAGVRIRAAQRHKSAS